jgi:transcriptional regulator with XRE-family HTH domain
MSVNSREFSDRPFQFLQIPQRGSASMPHTVADLCREQTITVEELANRTGLDIGRVTAIALGRWTPSPAERQKIAAVFGVPTGEISWGHATPIQHLYGHGPG